MSTLGQAFVRGFLDELNKFAGLVDLTNEDMNNLWPSDRTPVKPITEPRTERRSLHAKELAMGRARALAPKRVED